jgi:hypothetical protein
MAHATPSLWSLGGVDIYVDEHTFNKRAVIGIQHVLDATSDTEHHSGSSSRQERIGGTVYTTGSSEPELVTLEGFLESNTSRSLVSDVRTIGNFYVHGLECTRRQALNEPYPVYRVSIELTEA